MSVDIAVETTAEDLTITAVVKGLLYLIKTHTNNRVCSEAGPGGTQRPTAPSLVPWSGAAYPKGGAGWMAREFGKQLPGTRADSSVLSQSLPAPASWIRAELTHGTQALV